jgi:exopolysaccharide biosynthesis WecB/TagA/CpsF family protein
VIEHVFIGGVKIATASRDALTKTIVGDCLARRTSERRSSARLLFDANGHGISLAARDPDYRRALDEADVIHADGGFLVTLSRYIAGAAVRERSATTDLIHDVAAAGLGHGLSHYLLGATEDVNAQCAERLQELYPGIVIAGRHHGYFGPEQEAQLIDGINRADPDVLWIGLGKPGEQYFAVRNRERLRLAWAVTCGGCFNYVTGHYRRAPQWMQNHGLEWLFRAATSPQLLWRYAMTSPHAVWLALSRIDRRRVRDA